MRDICDTWLKRHAGIKVGYGQNGWLTHLRFADDIVLVGRSLAGIRRMLHELQNACANVGLRINFSKTCVLNNGVGRCCSQEVVEVNNNTIAIAQSTEYLGTRLSLRNMMDTEIRHRIAKAWRKFHSMKDMLCNLHVNVIGRLRLFESTVSPTLPYGCASWTMTRTISNSLVVTQRKMVRRIIGCKRLLGEEYVVWIKGATRKAEIEMAHAGLQWWTASQAERYWSWAGRINNFTDLRWTGRVFHWSPMRTRKQGRPCKRWTENLGCVLELASTKSIVENGNSRHETMGANEIYIYDFHFT